MSRAYTKEEVRGQFLNTIRNYVDYWDSVDERSSKEKLSGLAFSILNILDGTTIDLPAFNLSVDVHPSNKEYCQENNKNWYEQGMLINDDEMLHEMFYE